MKMPSIVCVLFAAITLQGAPQVTNVEAHQRYPWNGLVDIVVTIQGSADDIAEAECSFNATNCETGAAVPVTSIVQKGNDIGAGTTWTRQFVWNATSDVGAVKIDNLALIVDVKVLGGVQLWENGPYWAECNIGATKPEEYGYYFWWGDTVGYVWDGGYWAGTCYSGITWVSSGGVRMSASPFDTFTCETYKKSNSELQSAGYCDEFGNLVPSHDAATAHLGAPWRMPTDAEFTDLVNKCTSTLEVRNGVHGRLVSGKGSFASKHIFLPAAGYGDHAEFYEADSRGWYWSSSPNTNYLNNAFGIIDYGLGSSYFGRSSDDRYSGHSIRALRVAAGRGVTAHLKLDCRDDVRMCSLDGEVLCYDVSWYDNGQEVRISDNGTVITTGTVGCHTWHPETSCTSRHLLKLEVLSEGKVIGIEVAEFESEPSLAHSEIVTSMVVDPTCTKAGSTKSSKCSRCNAILSVPQVIAALGHVECVTIEPCGATCTSSGRTKGSYCTRCNAVLSTSSAIEALGHDERVIVEAKSPTCIEAGCTRGSCCQRCGIVLVSSEEIPALGHLPVVTKQAVKPTTVTAGRTEEIACSRCNVVLQASEVIEAIAYVCDVQARQLWPHKKVGVEFTVTKDVQSVANENAKLVLQCEIGGEIIPAEKIYGDMTLTPGRHHVIWDVEAQGVSVSTTSAKFRVGVSGAEESDVGLYTDALYCVIDLSGGATATHYPITYLSGVPSGGWSDEYKTSKLVLRYIAPGTFMMGSPVGETGRSSDEVQHEVTLTKGFWIGVFEVTQRQYELVMGENGSYFNNASCYASRPAECVSYNEIRGNSAGYQWSHPPFNADSDSFIGRIREKTGIPGFDLPSEAQWEYACRAGTTTPYNSGGLSRWSENSGLNKYTKSSDCSVATAKVGSFSPNGWGLYDMHGNVWEWCYDRYGTYGTNLTDPIGDSSSSYHVARGGAWNCTDVACRSARRNSSFARTREEKDTGFRLSCWSGLVR